MTNIPDNPKIYHITHIKNLPGIIETGGLWSDAMRIEKGFDCKIVGLSGIKSRRLYEIEVYCNPGTKVGDYVPFYFCPRSIMLYILHKGNLPELTYTGGQTPIVHLQADLHTVVDWARTQQRLWCFSDCNAGARYAEFMNDLTSLHELDWRAIKETDFRNSRIKENKQAEFLVHEWFPWSLCEKIGVQNRRIGVKVQEIIADTSFVPVVSIEPGWYF